MNLIRFVRAQGVQIMECRTQMRSARAGIITDAMRLVAEREEVAPELVRDEVARGRLIQG